MLNKEPTGMENGKDKTNPGGDGIEIGVYM